VVQGFEAAASITRMDDSILGVRWVPLVILNTDGANLMLLTLKLLLDAVFNAKIQEKLILTNATIFHFPPLYHCHWRMMMLMQTECHGEDSTSF
jgi:hypothetical protein